MERVSLFKPCEINYPQYDKPVIYTEEFLKEVASHTIGCKLVDNHYGKSIGNITNVTFTDGELWADVSSSKSLKKFSPSFDNLTLVDKGEYLLATEGKLVEVASTVKPRLDNSEGGSKMGEETIEFFQKEVKRLQDENTRLEFKAKQDKKKLEEYKEKEEEYKAKDAELEKLQKWKEENSKIIEEQKPIIDAYKADQEKVREDLLEKVSQGNPQIREQFKDCDNKTLESIVNLHTEEQPAKGVGAGNAPGIDEGNGEEDDAEAQREAEIKALSEMFPELNTKEE